jgi:hypothetical protein
MKKRGYEIEVGDVVDKSSIHYPDKESGFREVEEIKDEPQASIVQLYGPGPVFTSHEVVYNDEIVEVVGHIDELDSDTVEIDDADRAKFWRLDEEERAEVMRVAESASDQDKTIYVLPEGVGGDQGRVTWIGQRDYEKCIDKGAIKSNRKNEDDTMTPEEAIERFNAVAPKDAEEIESAKDKARRVCDTLSVAGWAPADVPPLSDIADYLDPLTFGDLDVGEVFRFVSSGDIRCKLPDNSHASVVTSSIGRVVKAGDLGLQAADPDDEVERVD